MRYSRRWLVSNVFGIVAAAAVAACSGSDWSAQPETFNLHATGDSLTIAGGLITVVVPPGSISEDGNLTATALPGGAVPPSALLVGQSAYTLELTPASVQVLLPLVVRVHYGALALPGGVRGPEVRLQRVVNGNWQPIVGGTNDSASGTVTAAVAGLGDFGVLGLPVAALTVNPPAIALTAGATRVITASPKDSLGQVLPSRPVTYSSSDVTKATVSATGVVTGVAPGSATITVTSEDESVQIPTTVTAGVVSVSRSTVAVSAGTVAAGGTVTLTLQAKDGSGNNLTGGGLVVAFTVTGGTSAGTIGATTDHADGTYTATFTATAAGTAKTVHATIGGTAVTSTLPTITVTAGAVSASRSTVAVAAGTVGVGGTVGLTLQAKDGSGNNLTSGGLAVVFTVSGGTSAGTIGATTDRANGTYTATFTATTAGTATTVHATIGGVAVTSTLPTITVTSVTVSLATSVVSVSVGTVTVGGTVALTLQAKDAGGSNLTTGGLVVAFTASGGTSAGTIGATTDHANGTYTATFTAATAGTATAVHATIGGAAVTSTAPSITVTAVSAGQCASPGAGWIWCDDFEQNRLASYFEYDDAGGGFVRAAGVGRNGGYGMRARWGSAGQIEAGSLHLAVGKTPDATTFRPADAGTQIYRDIYWRMYVRTQAGWTGGSAVKLSRAMVFVRADWSEAAIAHVWGETDATGYLTLDPVRATDAAGNLLASGYNDFANFTWLGLVRGNTELFASSRAGTWFCVEAHAKLNDAGQSNGLFQLWIDGTLDAERTGLNFLGAYAAYGFNAVFFENYWNQGASQAEERYFDDIVVSTQRIGC